jgi:hypothetical protein
MKDEIYKTPKKIIEYCNKVLWDSLIADPPFNNKNYFNYDNERIT